MLLHLHYRTWQCDLQSVLRVTASWCFLTHGTVAGRIMHITLLPIRRDCHRLDQAADLKLSPAR
jgi:hypothetical protein